MWGERKKGREISLKHKITAFTLWNRFNFINVIALISEDAITKTPVKGALI